MSIKLTKSENADPNYLAVVINLPKIRDHPNAEKLQVVEVFGNTIVIAKDCYVEGEKVVYFPVESCLKGAFLSWANLLTKPELNADGKTRGYFETKGRVKCVALRKVPSQGFLYRVSELARYYNADESVFQVGDVFDTVGDDLLVSKYVKGTERVPNEPGESKSRVPKWLNTTVGYLPKPIRRNVYLFINAWFNRKNEGIKNSILPGHFQYHGKTEHLGRNIFILTPEDNITITSKCHGTSAIYGMLPVKKTFNPLRSIWNFVGGKIPTFEHKLVYSSRSVVKNRRDGSFTDDAWGIHAKELTELLKRDSNDLTFYGEIVGYTPTGRMIQKNYNYGVPVGQSEFWVYRVTQYSHVLNKIVDLAWNEIELISRHRGFKTVPVYYNGLAKDLFPDILRDESWNDNFLKALKEKYLDRQCEFCTTGVVNEGVVLKINDKETKPVFKFKSPQFLIKESAARDAGEEDLEEES